MIGPAFMPWNWGKFVDQHRNTKPEDYAQKEGNILRGFAARRQALEKARSAAGMKPAQYQQGGSVTNNTTNIHNFSSSRVVV